MLFGVTFHASTSQLASKLVPGLFVLYRSVFFSLIF